MKVLVLITGLGVGGAERVVVNLCDYLTQRGIKVKLVYFYGDPLVVPVSKEIEVLRFPASIFSISLLRKLVYEFEPDIVHTHMYHANMIGRLLKLFLPKITLINTAHSSSDGGLLRDFLYRATNFLAAKFVNVSESAVKAFESRGAVAKGRMTVVYNGIDLNKFQVSDIMRNACREELKLSDSETFLLSVGSLRDAKNYDLAIDAARLMLDNQIEFKWFIIGEGPERGRLEIKIEKAGLINNVFFLGHRSNVEFYMNGCDIFVLTSKWEGFGLVLAEAMACKKLIVTTDCGSIDEVIGKSQFVSPVEDSQMLATNIVKAISTPTKLRAEYINYNYDRVNELFCSERSNSNWLKIYKLVLEK